MKIAIPVKTNNTNPAVSPMFGKAKWFAFVEDNQVAIVKNSVGGGQAVIRWFIESGVDTVIIQEMGATPYEMIKAHGGMKLYHSGDERIMLEELLAKFHANMLRELDEDAMQEIIAHHEGSHTHGDHNLHGDHRHHQIHHDHLTQWATTKGEKQ
jgi:predicted Fe-Mo cluster-binding NifX family protein